MLEGKPTPLNALADTLVGAGKSAWALEYYEAISDAIPSSVLKRVRCLLNMEQPEEAMKLLQSIPEVADMVIPGDTATVPQGGSAGFNTHSFARTSGYWTSG